MTMGNLDYFKSKFTPEVAKELLNKIVIDSDNQQILYIYYNDKLSNSEAVCSVIPNELHREVILNYCETYKIPVIYTTSQSQITAQEENSIKKENLVFGVIPDNKTN